MKDIAKHYALLTPEERFRLFVEAMGRKDEQEIDRLEATCPRRRYDAQDYEYARKKCHFTVLALASALQQLRIELLAFTALVIALANDDEATAPSAEKARDAFVKFMRVRGGKRNGWLRFCQRIAVNPDAIAAPFLENVESALVIADAISETLEADDPDGCKDAEVIAAREFEGSLDAWDHAA